MQVGTQTLYPIPVKVTNADEARQSSANEGGGAAGRGRIPEGECVLRHLACTPASHGPPLEHVLGLPRPRASSMPANYDTVPAGAVRRFFFVDKQLGYSAQSRALQAVQYPTSVYLEVMQRDSPRDKIYVPQLTIRWVVVRPLRGPRRASWGSRDGGCRTRGVSRCATVWAEGAAWPGTRRLRSSHVTPPAWSSSVGSSLASCVQRWVRLAC